MNEKVSNFIAKEREQQEREQRERKTKEKRLTIISNVILLIWLIGILLLIVTVANHSFLKNYVVHISIIAIGILLSVIGSWVRFGLLTEIAKNIRELNDKS